MLCLVLTDSNLIIPQIVSYCQDWMMDNVIPTIEAPGSLALQMNQRAEDEEKVRYLI